MTGRAIKEFQVVRDDLFNREPTDITVLLLAPMRASYDALAATGATT